MTSTSFLEINPKNFENMKNNDDDDGDIIVLEEVSSNEKNLSNYLNKSFVKSTPLKRNSSFSKFYVKKSTTSKNKDIHSTSQQNSDYGSFNNNLSRYSNSTSQNKFSETDDDDIFDQENDDSINNEAVRNSFKRKKNSSSSTSFTSSTSRNESQSEDCIILEEKNADESFVLLLRKSPNLEVFALKDKTKHIWKRANLVSIKEEDEVYEVKFKKIFKNESYLVKEFENETDREEEQIQTLRETATSSPNSEMCKTIKMKNKKKSSFICVAENSLDDDLNDEATIQLDSRSVAYAQLGCVEFNETAIKIKSRVVSYCKLEMTTRDQKLTLLDSNYLCSGTIAETPCKKNDYRYLIFFDNGYVSYAKRNRIYYIFDYFSMPVERLGFDHIYFLRSYFDSYPTRSMVQLEPNDVVTVYLRDKWHDCKVIDVEGSLVKIDLTSKLFNISQNLNYKILHNIWFYRGSPKLLPIYDTIMNKITNYDVETTMPSAYEKYLIDKRKKRLDDEKRNASIKFHCFSSTLFPNSSPEIRITNNVLTSVSNKLEEKLKEEKLDGEIIYLDLSEKIANLSSEYMMHECSSECVFNWEDLSEIKRLLNPLLKPILFGWQRHIFTQSKSRTNGSKKWVNYMAPCGKTLRSTGEVDRYLYATNSMLTIDMFTFDYYIQITREFVANSKYLSIDDICDGKETIPISCVNSVDNEKPDYFVYSPIRSAMKGVPLDTECSKLEGCNCEDNCRDRSKCKCWRKTFELTTYAADKEINTNIGYRGRRLPQMVNTGIFECNSNCKCDHRCSNRVAQNGISLRLQLFKTSNKGWGLRCLDDIPKGAFISCYSGQLMTEEQSLERNQEYGDTYFAELDFIECIRKLKEGYVYGTDLVSSSSASSSDESDLELNHSKHVLPRKSSFKVNNQPELEYVCIDSDEDDQDRELKSPDKNSLSESQQLIKERKQKELEISINSNRFFKNMSEQVFGEYMLNKQLYILDASVCGNIARFLNHSCTPNVFVQNVFIDTYDFRFPWIAFFASTFIKAGTELCWDYGYIIDSVKGKRLNCYCNTSRCRGRLL